MEEHESLGRLLGCLHRHARMYFRREFSSRGLGSGIPHFLVYLHHHDGCTQQDLSRGLHMDKANSARAVKKLLQFGLAERKRDPRDRRAFRLFLTDRGRSLLPGIERTMSAWTDIISRGLTDAERGQAMRLLRKMSANAVSHIHHRSDSGSVS